MFEKLVTKKHLKETIEKIILLDKISSRPSKYILYNFLKILVSK